MMRVALSSISIVLLAASQFGCAQIGMVLPGIAPPSSRLMVPPEQLQPVKAGSDIVVAMAELRAKYGRETGKLSQLQAYVKRLTKKKE